MRGCVILSGFFVQSNVMESIRLPDCINGDGNLARQYLQHTGKSLSEALIFAEHGENMLCTKIVLSVKNNFLSLKFSCIELIIP